MLWTTNYPCYVLTTWRKGPLSVQKLPYTKLGGGKEVFVPVIFSWTLLFIWYCWLTLYMFLTSCCLLLSMFLPSITLGWGWEAVSTGLIWNWDSSFGGTWATWGSSSRETWTAWGSRLGGTWTTWGSNSRWIARFFQTISYRKLVNTLLYYWHLMSIGVM